MGVLSLCSIYYVMFNVIGSKYTNTQNILKSTRNIRLLLEEKALKRAWATSRPVSTDPFNGVITGVELIRAAMMIP